MTEYRCKDCKKCTNLANNEILNIKRCIQCVNKGEDQLELMWVNDVTDLIKGYADQDFPISE